MQSKKSGIITLFIICAMSVILTTCGSADLADPDTPSPVVPSATPTETRTPLPPTSTPAPVDVVFDYYRSDGIRTRPDPLLGITQSIEPGDTITILGRSPQPYLAYLVRLSSGSEGWLLWRVGMFELPEGARIPRVTPPASPTGAPAPRSTATRAPAPCSCGSDLYNCNDFGTQSQAQACFNYCPGDVHGLDSDGDGRVCESLP